jgi:hypothetical protein
MTTIPPLPLTRSRRGRISWIIGIAVAILVVIGIAYFGSSKLHRITLAAITSDNEIYIGNRAQSEWSNAWEDHYSAALWFAHCVDRQTVTALPKEFAAQLTPFADKDWSGSGDKLEKQPQDAHWQVVQLSKSLFRQRVGGASRMRDAFISAQVMQWTIITLGLLTTIVVALSSTEYGKGEGSGARTLRLFAIMLPAFGTAIAAFNAFYAPGQEQARATRTLASFGQLHNQVALEVWTAGCDTASKDPNGLPSKIAQWVKRYQDVQSLAGTSAETQSAAGPKEGGASGSSRTNVP